MAETTYLEAIKQALQEEMERDENVFVMGEDIGAYGGAFKVTEGLQARFGESRVIDTPISEAAIVGAAAGAAHMGMRPVCEMQFIDFISCAYDMLTNYVATSRYRAFLPCPLVVRGTPGLKIVYPATASDAKGLLKAAIRDDDPVLYFEHKYLYRRIKEDLPEGGDHIVPIGKARTAREGKDLSIITYAATVWKSLEAAEQLEKEDGLSVEVIDLRSLSPLDDEAIIATVKKTNRVMIVHEDTRTGGVAGRSRRADSARHRGRRASAVLAAARGLCSASDAGHRQRGAPPGGVLKGDGRGAQGRRTDQGRSRRRDRLSDGDSRLLRRGNDRGGGGPPGGVDDELHPARRTAGVPHRRLSVGGWIDGTRSVADSGTVAVVPGHPDDAKLREELIEWHG